jgi:hypothetical protein
MRSTKSLLLAAAAALALGTGAAFAGQDSTVEGSVENSPPDLLSEPSTELLPSMEIESGAAEIIALEEGDVIYVFPADSVEYSESYLVIPDSGEMPG